MSLSECHKGSTKVVKLQGCKSKDYEVKVGVLQSIAIQHCPKGVVARISIGFALRAPV